MPTPVPKGRIVWYENLTSDPMKAKDFYTNLIGWTITTSDFAGRPYHMWTNGGTTLGGVMELPEQAAKMGAPPNWLMYVAVPDVDATTVRAAELGARALAPPMDIPTVGRFAVLADPQGAVFAIFQPADQATPSPEGSPKVGEFSWHELTTTDYAAAIKFYSEIAGWQQGPAHDMGPMGIYQIFGRTPDRPLGGMFNKPPDMPFPPNWLLYIRVADLDATVLKVAQLGGKVLNGPMEVPGGDRVAQCMDPLGAAFALHWTKSA